MATQSCSRREGGWVLPHRSGHERKRQQKSKQTNKQTKEARSDRGDKPVAPKVGVGEGLDAVLRALTLGPLARHAGGLQVGHGVVVDGVLVRSNHAAHNAGDK